MTAELPAIGQTMVDQQVAVTGRLASMSRPALAELVERRGGRFGPNVNRQTTLLVVGREGWPLRSDGQLTRKLQRARELRQQGNQLEIVPEETFLRHLELSQAASEVCRSYTVAELTRLLEVPRRRIEAWQRTGLLRPTDSDQSTPCFDFRQVAAARSLAKLVDAGVSPRKLNRSLFQLRSWLPIEDDLGDMPPRVVHDGERIMFRTDTGSLVEGDGQLLLEFEREAELPAIVEWRAGEPSDQLFEEAVRLEQQGKLAEAAKRYRRLLLDEGSDADVCFNLANVLHAQGETAAAIERLHEAVMIDRANVDAWNNLGNLLAEVNRLEEAREAYEHAVEVEPEYADARYGLADVLDQLGRFDDAGAQWRTYLRQEPVGPWADYARKRLASRLA